MKDCFSNIPGQNGIFVQTVLIIKVSVSFAKPKLSKMTQTIVSFLYSVLPVLDLLFKGAWYYSLENPPLGFKIMHCLPFARATIRVHPEDKFSISLIVFFF